jgi:hypothetical protein
LEEPLPNQLSKEKRGSLVSAQVPMGEAILAKMSPATWHCIAAGVIGMGVGLALLQQQAALKAQAVAGVVRVESWRFSNFLLLVQLGCGKKTVNFKDYGLCPAGTTTTSARVTHTTRPRVTHTSHTTRIWITHINTHAKHGCTSHHPLLANNCPRDAYACPAPPHPHQQAAGGAELDVRATEKGLVNRAKCRLCLLPDFT